MRKNKSEQGGAPVPLSAAVPQRAPDRMVDGVPVRTYRGESLAALAPQIRAEVGDNAMILRQREGVTGGIAGFFAKRMVEIDVAIIQAPGAPHIDTTDGPSVGPQRLLPDLDGAPPAAGPFPAQQAPSLEDPQAAPTLQPTVPFSAIADQHGLVQAHQQAARARGHEDAPSGQGQWSEGLDSPAVPPGVPLMQPSSPAAFKVGAPSAAETAQVKAALAAGSAERAAHRESSEAPPELPPSIAPIPELVAPALPALPPASEPTSAGPPATLDEFDSPFDPGRRGADPAPVTQTIDSFEDRVRTAGLTDAGADSDPVAQLGELHTQLVRRGLPDQIASPVVDDTLLHRVVLQPGRPVAELLASELARRIPTAPLAGRAGQAVAFVGSSGAGKTRAIARLAAAYGAAARVPVACVTLQDSGNDGLLATALAPFGIAVHAAPDAPRALDRITALRRTCLVLIDTPGVSPGDIDAVDRLGATLQLLELDQVALCLPVVLAAPIARRVLRAMRSLGPSILVATHADEADLLGGVVAVAIDRRVPLAYVSAGAGRGGIVGADAHHIAAEMLAGQPSEPGWSPRPTAVRAPAGRRATVPIDRRREAAPPEPQPATAATSAADDPRQSGPSIDVAAGAAHLAVPWIMSSPRRPQRRGQ